MKERAGQNQPVFLQPQQIRRHHRPSVWLRMLQSPWTGKTLTVCWSFWSACVCKLTYVFGKDAGGSIVGQTMISIKGLCCNALPLAKTPLPQPLPYCTQGGGTRSTNMEIMTLRALLNGPLHSPMSLDDCAYRHSFAWVTKPFVWY